MFPSVRMMQRLAAAAGLTAVAASAWAAEPAVEPASAWTETGNITAVSDYLFRGISQTQAKPTAQATLDFTHRSGFYLGLHRA